jgi:beta-mannosidase
VHHPAWKARAPRDLGAGWDFEDVRDHYLREVFQVEPLTLRYADHERYLELSRIATAEAVGAAFRQWRRKDAACRGALVWFLRDLWRGAGWGVVDSDGRPKAPWYAMRRTLQPRTVLLTDEGGNGLCIHLVNERAEALRAQLELAAYRTDGVRVAHARQEIEMPARATLAWEAAALLEGFMDLTYAYRFGPPPHDVVVATLFDASGHLIAEDFYFPLGHSAQREGDIGLEARAAQLADGGWQLLVRARHTARHVQIRAPYFEASDQYFHLAPGVERTLALVALKPGVALRGVVHASNVSHPSRIHVES